MATWFMVSRIRGTRSNARGNGDKSTAPRSAWHGMAWCSTAPRHATRRILRVRVTHHRDMGNSERSSSAGRVDLHQRPNRWSAPGSVLIVRDHHPHVRDHRSSSTLHVQQVAKTRVRGSSCAGVRAAPLGRYVRTAAPLPALLRRRRTLQHAVPRRMSCSQHSAAQHQQDGDQLHGGMHPNPILVAREAVPADRGAVPEARPARAPVRPRSLLLPRSLFKQNGVLFSVLRGSKQH